MYYLDYDMYKDICNSDKLSKSFDVDKILSDENLKWFDTSVLVPPYYIDSDGKTYYPIDIITSVRSVYSNLVLCNNDNCYVLKQCRDKCPHRGSDLVMFETSRNVFSFFDTLKLDMELFNSVMMYHSIFQLVGLLNIAGCPTFYTHIILQDDSIDTLKPFLKESCRFVSISDLAGMNCNPVALVESFIELKGDKDEAK